MALGAEIIPEWEAFYVIIGTSAAALTGLQFVVMTLLVEAKPREAAMAISAFGTPTIVHFSTVVLLSGILSAPWHEMGGVSAAVGAVGVGGLIYTGITLRRILRQSAYTPVFEDWLWHVTMPILAYAATAVSALGMLRAAGPFLFLTAAAVLVLMVTGIHNAWDTTVFIAEGRVGEISDKKAEAPGS
jgi:hypothetical protein